MQANSEGYAYVVGEDDLEHEDVYAWECAEYKYYCPECEELLTEDNEAAVSILKKPVEEQQTLEK